MTTETNTPGKSGALDWFMTLIGLPSTVVLAASGAALHLWSAWLVLMSPAFSDFTWASTFAALITLVTPLFAEAVLVLLNWLWTPALMGPNYTALVLWWAGAAAVWTVVASILTAIAESKHPRSAQ
jgi:hypothetical protein